MSAGDPQPGGGSEPPRFSLQLAELFGEGSGPGPDLTLNELLSRTADRGPYGLIILLSLPFMAPVALPGLSNIFGLVIALLAWRIFRGEAARLPRGLGNRSVQGRVLSRIVRTSIRVLAFVERMTRARGPAWLQSGNVRRFNALVLIYGGLLLAAPIPPIIPVSNFAPAVGILLMAASMMERDGLMIWAGYGATLLATVYIVAMALLQYQAFLMLWHRFADPIGGFFRRMIG